MKKIFRIVPLVLAFALCSTTVACDGGNSSSQSSSSSVESSSSSSVAESGFTYTITVVDQDGLPVEGAQLTLSLGVSDLGTFETDANGSVTGETESGGEFMVAIESLPYGYYYEEYLNFVTVEDETPAVITVENTNANGEEDRPYYLILDENGNADITVAANSSVYYSVRAMGRTLMIENCPVSVVLDGVTYAPDENGRLELSFANYSDSFSVATFGFVNATDAEASFVLSLRSPLGQMDNPVQAYEDVANTVTLSGTDEVYCVYNATANGILRVWSENANNSMYAYNLTSYSQSEETAGRNSTYVAVSAGDTVRIVVRADEPEEEAFDLVFYIDLYEGTESDPIVLNEGICEITVAAGNEVYFVAEVSGTVEFYEEGITLKVNGATVGRDDVRAEIAEGDVISFVNGGEGVRVRIECKQN